MKSIYNKGMNLIEIMVVISIMVIIIAIVTPNLSSFKNKQSMTNTIEDISSLLNEARNNTISSKDSTSYGVHFETDRAVLFSGTTYNSNASDNKVVMFDSSVYIPTGGIGLTGGVSDVKFLRIMGNTNQNGIIIFRSYSVPTLQKMIAIERTGLIHET